MAGLSDPLVLPMGVELVPVATLPEGVREHLEYEEGDVAIARLRSRVPSKVISAEAAALVEQFRKPRKLVEAIILYSAPRGLDPHQTLDDAMPILQQLMAAGLIVPADSAAAAALELTLRAGERFAGFTIVRAVHFLEDVELFLARADDGGFAALKAARPGMAGGGAGKMLAREAAVLRLLEGDVTPALLACGEEDGRYYIAMSWCDGVTVDAAAAELREDPTPAGRAAMLRLAASVLDTYARLHGRGVIHGDVHPRNVLVDGSGSVRLIDFGLARVPGSAEIAGEPYRGGVAFYYEPEFAEATRAGRMPPPASPESEQYGLAVLLYQLFTGLHYLDFSLEQDEMLRQIAQDPPLPFERQGLAAWPAVEEALARGLCKDPAGRYPDAAAFAEALRRVALADTTLRSTPPGGDDGGPEGPGPLPGDAPELSRASAALRDEVLARLGWDGEIFRNGPPRAPLASLNMGAAGIAFALYRIAASRGDPDLLTLADVWAQRAAAFAGDPADDNRGFFNPEIDATPETLGRISPYHSPTGIFAVQALIAWARGDYGSAEAAVLRFVAWAEAEPCEKLDLTLGRSGLLVAGALLCEAARGVDPTLPERAGLLRLGNRTMAEVWQVLDGYPPIDRAPQLTNLGIAHGWGGMLYAALRWCEATGCPPPACAEARLRELAALAEPAGRGVRWPWQLDNPDLYMPGWCNGSAGYVYLWTLAARFTGDPAYRALAEKAAWNCWEDEAGVASLCCGLAGRAYAVLRWYGETRDPAWLRRATVLAGRAAINIRAIPVEDEKGFENSLYKGEMGVLALLVDLERPEDAALPFFASEGWPKAV